MGSISREVGLDLRLFSAARTAGGFLREAAAAAAGDDDAGADKLEGFLRALDDEKWKIEAFKRELPLCRLLVRDVIRVLKKELDQCRKGGNCGAQRRRPAEEEAAVPEVVDEDCKDKRSWMSSAQLWSDGCSKDDDEKKITQVRSGDADRRRPAGETLPDSNSNGGGHGGFWGFQVISPAARKEEKPMPALPELSLLSPSTDNPSCSGHLLAFPNSKTAASRSPNPAATTGGSVTGLSQQQQRKTRRCWSPELHRRFVVALQQLGGAQAATPKQIREAMKVDGLTNDEVKSHLQKYRLHTRRRSPASATAAAISSPSGSPQSPLQLAGASRAISLTAEDSYEEEDGRSESFSWK